MNQPSLSLTEVLKHVRIHADDGQWREAEALCSQLFELLPDSLLQATAWHWISVLRLQQRHNEACCVLHRLLQRLPWGCAIEGQRPARVVVVQGLDSLRRSHVQFRSVPWGRPDFQITCGHFDIHALLSPDELVVDHLYVGPALEQRQFDSIQDRLGSYQVIINSIADPACESPSLEIACRLLAGHRNVINPPQLVQQTERDLIADCLRELPGLVVPAMLRIEELDEPARSELHQRLEHSRSGLILRPLDSQTGLGMQRVVDPVALDAWLDVRPGNSLFASDYHDFRMGNRLFCKYRVFVIDGELLPEHMICARHWNLHSEDRYSLMDSTPLLREAEQQFLQDPAAVLGQHNIELLRAIGERTRLDYIGIDFALLSCGDLLLFEANPAMRLNSDHCTAFPYLQPHMDSVRRAFCARINRMLS